MNRSSRARFPGNILFVAPLFLLLAAALGQYTAQAQNQGGIQLAAQAGLNGYCKDNTWIPIRVTVENTGPDVNGRVQVSYQNNSNSQSIYGKDLSFPTTSRKEFFLYFYPDGFVRNLRVSLIANGKMIAKDDLSLSCMSADNLIFGVLSDDPSAYDILSDIRPLKGFARVAQLRFEDLPDRPQGWTSLDALIVAGTDTGALTDAQRRSLAAWLANGGRLLVVGGPKWQSTAAGLQDVLPMDITSTQTLPDLSALPAYFQDSNLLQGETTLAVGGLRAGADVLIEQEGLPILVEKQIGFGKVMYLAADPSLRPLSDWDHMADAYAYLLGAQPARPEWMTGVWDPYSASQAVTTIAGSGIPSFVYICGWLVLYVIVIGPVNFLILRRLKRRDLAWFTIPVVVILFSGAAYLYGSVYRGQHPILNRIAVVQAWDDSKTAEVRGLIGLYSPRRAKYLLQANSGFMFYPFNNSNGSPQNEDWLTLQSGDETLMPDVRVEIGGVKSLSVQGTLPALALDHDLGITINDNNPMLSGTLTNTSPYTLRDAVLVTSGDWQRLHDLAPGTSIKVSIRLTPGSDGPDFYRLDVMNILNLNYSNYRDSADSIRRQAILAAVLRSSSYTANKGNWGVYLMGWLDQPMLPVNVQGEAFQNIDTTLYIAQLTPSVRYQGTTWKLTPGLFAWEASFEDASPYYTSQIPTGGYTLRFRPAIPIHFSSVEQLILNINNQTSVTSDKISASLWNFENKQWERLGNLVWGRNDIPNPDRYVGPGGEIMLKIDGSPNDYVQIGPSSFTLVVKP